MNSTNVWGNLQPAEQVVQLLYLISNPWSLASSFHSNNIGILWQPQRLRWDFSNSSDWLPLFPGQPPAMQSVQVFSCSITFVSNLTLSAGPADAISSGSQGGSSVEGEGVLVSRKDEIYSKFDSGGEDAERFDYEPTPSLWTSHSP